MQNATPRRSSDKLQCGIGRRFEDLEAVPFEEIQTGHLTHEMQGKGKVKKISRINRRWTPSSSFSKRRHDQIGSQRHGSSQDGQDVSHQGERGLLRGTRTASRLR